MKPDLSKLAESLLEGRPRKKPGMSVTEVEVQAPDAEAVMGELKSALDSDDMAGAVKSFKALVSLCGSGDDYGEEE